MQAKKIDEDLDVTTSIVVPEVKLSSDPAARARIEQAIVKAEEDFAVEQLKIEQAKADAEKKRILEQQIALIKQKAMEEEAAKQSEGSIGWIV